MSRIVFILATFLFSSALFLSCTKERVQESGSVQKEEQITQGEDSTVATVDTATPSIDEKPIVPSTEPLTLTPRSIEFGTLRHLLKQKKITLNVPEGYGIAVAAEGLKRVRFMAFSPDDRLFVTDMQNLSDNSIGKLYVFEEFDSTTKKLGKRTTYLSNLRNPNNIAFYTDESGEQWLYLALTDRLIRYRYQNGDNAPQGEPEELLTFPDYGLSYKYGGWHLTRTVTFGDNNKLYISVGSSCNVCEEKEEVRATVVEMNPDGSAQRYYAKGLRNAVGIRWVNGALFATNMGADHLGDDRPEDGFYRLEGDKHYGWPYTYEYQGKVYADPIHDTSSRKVPPSEVPLSYAGFAAHSSPLGFDWFGDATDSALLGHFLVGLHGPARPKNNRGYAIARVVEGEVVDNFIDGFAQGRKRLGRPCDVLNAGNDTFFFTDDYAGVIYYVFRQ